MTDTKETTGDRVAQTLGLGSSVQLSTGVDIEVNRLKLKSIPKFLAVINSIKGDINSARDDAEKAVKEAKANGTDVLAALDAANFDGGMIVDILTKHFEECCELLKLVSNITEEQLDDLFLDDACVLVFKAIEVNQRFFIERVLPYVATLLTAVDEVKRTGQVLQHNEQERKS